MDNRYIGVFDSGLGGLSCVKHIMKEMPAENVIYFGDTGRVPYGSRSRETIVRYVTEDIEFLESHNVKIIIAACGTASAVALDIVRLRFRTPIIGVVEPAVKAAISATKNGKIGVIGTEATISTGKYEGLIAELEPKAQVFPKSCPLFVPLVEHGHTKSEAARLIAREYLAPLKEFGVDTIILGCTHYPLLRGIISDIMGVGTALIDSGAEAAGSAKAYLKKFDMLSDMPYEKQYKYYVSDKPENFSRLGGLFLGQPIGCVKKAPLEG